MTLELNYSGKKWGELPVPLMVEQMNYIPYSGLEDSFLSLLLRVPENKMKTSLLCRASALETHRVLDLGVYLYTYKLTYKYISQLSRPSF